MITRRLVIGLLGAGAVTFALYAAPVALAFSPETHNVQVTRPAQVTGALGTGYVTMFPPTKGTAIFDPNRAFSPTAYNSGGAGISGTIGDYARFLQMLLNEGELGGVRVLRAETVRQMTQNATGSMPTLRGPGWGFTLGFGIVTDPAAAKTRLPAGSYGRGGIYGTQFWSIRQTASSAWS
jgi:CubicO group peptidase (beta-lactamase class C family)